jgi:hypothetical protein
VSVPVAASIAGLFEGVAALAATLVPLGPAAGVPLAVMGALGLTVATRWRRPLAIAGGAAIGALAALALRGLAAAHLGLSAGATALLLGGAGAAAGAALPGAFPFAAAALPGALLGAQVPLAGRSALGAAAGGLVLGLLGLAFGRLVAAAFASACGALLLALGVVASFGRTEAARELAGRPAALVGAALVLAIAGVARQATGAGTTTPVAPAARSPGSPP